MSYHEPPPEYGGQPGYPQYGYPQYGSPYGGMPVEHPRGTTILILGILSLVACGFLTGIPAWVMGHSARKEIEAAPNRYTNGGVVKAGWICGIIGTIITALVFVLYAVLIAVAIATEAGTT